MKLNTCYHNGNCDGKNDNNDDSCDNNIDNNKNNNYNDDNDNNYYYYYNNKNNNDNSHNDCYDDSNENSDDNNNDNNDHVQWSIIFADDNDVHTRCYILHTQEYVPARTYLLNHDHLPPLILQSLFLRM